MIRFFGFLILLSLIMSGCSQVAKVDYTILQDEEDRREIIRLALEIAIGEQRVPDYNILINKNNIVVSTENIVENELPSFNGITFDVLSPKQIKRKAKKEGDFLYLIISPLKQEGETVIVSINNVWAMQKSLAAPHLSGGGFELKFMKVNGVWEAEIIKLWMS